MNRVDFIVNIGTDWKQEIVISDVSGNPVDLSPYTISTGFKKHYMASKLYPIDYTVNSNVLILSISAITSSTIFDGRYDYDVVVTDSSNIKSKILEGVITFNPTINK